MKRSFDIILSLSLLFLLSPVLAIAAIGVRLSSEGPVLFRAPRVGRGGVLFEMLKFRTMHLHDNGPVITSRGDSRIFPFGVFLRKSKIDE